MARVFKKNPKSTDWWIDYKDTYSRRRREKVGPNRALAFQVLGEKLKRVTEEIELGVKHIDKMSFEDFCQLYMDRYAKPNKRSWQRDKIVIYKHLVPFFKGKFLSEVEPQTIERFKAQRSDRVKPATVNRELCCLKTVLSKAVEWGKLRENPARNVKNLKMDNRRLVFLEREECEAFLEACPARLRPIVETFLLTGLRKSELFGLRWEDIDYKAGVIHVMRSKSGKARQIPLNSRLTRILKRIPRHIAGEFVFCRRNGKPWADVRKSFQAALGEAGIGKHVTFHTLRHTYASHLVMAGVDLYTVAALLGHSNIEMTQRYAHLSPDHKARAQARLEAYFARSESYASSLGSYMGFPVVGY